MFSLGFLHRERGVFYADENIGSLLKANSIGLFVIIGWVACVSAVFFTIVKKWLRVPKGVEIAGIDFEEALEMDPVIRKFFFDIMDVLD